MRQLECESAGEASGHWANHAPCHQDALDPAASGQEGHRPRRYPQWLRHSPPRRRGLRRSCARFHRKWTRVR
eukprot:2892702-Pyramimonas_sp.AAC.1